VHLTTGTSANGNPVVQMDWVNVGYFPTSATGNTGATNTFTLYIENDPAGDIVAFNYGSMNWTTGDASGGTNGFGGSGAQIGFDSGDGINLSASDALRSSQPECNHHRRSLCLPDRSTHRNSRWRIRVSGRYRHRKQCQPDRVE